MKIRHDDMDLKYQFVFCYLLVVISFIPIFLLSYSFVEDISTSSQHIILFSCSLFVLLLGILAITGRLYSILYKISLLSVDFTYTSLILWIHSGKDIPISTVLKHIKNLNSSKDTSYVDVTRVIDIDPKFAKGTFYAKDKGDHSSMYDLENETVFVTFLKGHFYGAFHLDPTDLSLNKHTETPIINSSHHTTCDVCINNSTYLQMRLSDSVRDIETEEIPICEPCLDELLQEVMNNIDSQYHKEIAANAL